MEEAIASLLLADTGVTALVGNRISPSTRPQGRSLPAVTYQLISGAPGYADDGETGLSEKRIQFDCWGKTYTEAKNTARAIASVLSAFSGSSEGVEFQYVMLDSEQDFTESGSNAKRYPFRSRIDFIVLHK